MHLSLLAFSLTFNPFLQSFLLQLDYPSFHHCLFSPFRQHNTSAHWLSCLHSLTRLVPFRRSLGQSGSQTLTPERRVCACVCLRGTPEEPERGGNAATEHLNSDAGVFCAFTACLDSSLRLLFLLLFRLSLSSYFFLFMSALCLILICIICYGFLLVCCLFVTVSVSSLYSFCSMHFSFYSNVCLPLSFLS